MTSASAHGRVNLIGEHTDYNGGFVLPAPIPQRTTVELRRTPGDEVHATSLELSRQESYRLGEERRRGGWIDYVQGCTAMLSEAGHVLGGMDLVIASDVPLGSGLSSSAALEVAVLRAIRAEFALTIDDTALALLGQRAEHELVGAPVGAMDQLCASLGSLGAALFIDMRTLDARRVALPPELALIVIASGVRHDHATGDYRTRRRECEEAARLLGVEQLRDVEAGQLAATAALPPPLDRRARHVVTENARVLAAVAALARGDLAAFGELMNASHRSMRDDFEVSIPAIDTLVELAVADPAVLGARLTGGGFGGSIVAIARPSDARCGAQRIADGYRTRTGHSPQVLLAGALA